MDALYQAEQEIEELTEQRTELLAALEQATQLDGAYRYLLAQKGLDPLPDHDNATAQIQAAIARTKSV